jgi:plastocyanin
MMRRMMMVVALAAFGVACGGGGDQQEAPVGDQAGGPAETPALGTASITGAALFTGTPPENPAIDMAEEPACRDKHPEGPRDPEVVVTGGKLANVFVYVKSGLPAGATFPRPSAPAVIDQNGCLYEPRVLGVMVGQPLEIRNSDPVSHNIKAVPATNRGFNISQPQAGMTTTRTFTDPEVMVPLECNVHGWMNAFVGVTAHPYFAVSGPDGSFTISGLPAGAYELEAWHEKFGTRTASVTVTDGGQATVEFTFSAN